MSGFLSFLSQGSAPPTSTSSVNSQNSMPLYYAQYQQALLQKANDVASETPATYGAPRIAAPNAQQTQAFNYLGDNATNWQPTMDAATSMVGNAGNFDPNSVNNFMSPYTKNVTDEIGRLGMQNLNENLLPDLQGQFVGSGGFGSSRNMDMAERLVRDTGQNILGQQSTALNTGYNSAMANALQAGNLGVTAGTNLGTLARTQQNLTTGTAGALEASGATQRSMDQSNLDLGYEDFLNQQQMPRQNVSFLSSILQGQQVPTSTSQTTTAPYSGSMSPSPLATLGGLAATAYGASQAVPKARGGMIRLARGGSPLMAMRRMRPAYSGGALPMVSR